MRAERDDAIISKCSLRPFKRRARRIFWSKCYYVVMICFFLVFVGWPTHHGHPTIGRKKMCVLFIFIVQLDRGENKMFPFKCSFMEWTDVTFFLNFNYFSTSQQFGIDIYFLTNPKQTNHHSCQRRLAAQTAIFECSFNVFVLLLREQLMHLLVFSVWFRVH